MAIDIIFIAVAGFGFYVGFSRGIIQTIFTVLSFLIGIMAAVKFSPAMTRFLETAFDNDSAFMFLAGFLLTFVLTMLLIRMVARGLEGVLEAGGVNIINQLAGGMLLALLNTLLFSVLLWFADQSRLISQPVKTESRTYEYLEDFPGYVWNAGKVLRPTFEDFWDHIVEFMNRMENTIEREESPATIFDKPDNEDDQAQNY